MRRFLALSFAFILSLALRAQDKAEQYTPKVNWMDLESAMEQFKKQPKPLLIDVYTDWCKWCHYMEKTTYSSEGLASYINTRFYPVKFNAETDDTVSFLGKTYTKAGRANNLARELLDGRLSYPSTVFFDRRLNKTVVPGYLSIKDIEPLLVYFSEDLSLTVSLDDFMLSYMYLYPQRYAKELEEQTKKLDTSGVVNWLTANEAFAMVKKNPKPVFIYSYVSWCNSCKVFSGVIFRDSTVAAVLNSEFYPVMLDAATTDTIYYQGKAYASMGKGQPNAFAMLLFSRGFKFPAMFFMDANLNLVGNTFGFYNAEQTLDFLNYFSENYYKTESFSDYLKHRKTEKSKP